MWMRPRPWLKAQAVTTARRLWPRDRVMWPSGLRMSNGPNGCGRSPEDPVTFPGRKSSHFGIMRHWATFIGMNGAPPPTLYPVLLIHPWPQARFEPTTLLLWVDSANHSLHHHAAWYKNISYIMYLTRYTPYASMQTLAQGRIDIRIENTSWKDNNFFSLVSVSLVIFLAAPTPFFSFPLSLKWETTCTEYDSKSKASPLLFIILCFIHTFLFNLLIYS